jgi:type IV pilus secretin PilQ/predicted competence protein
MSLRNYSSFWNKALIGALCALLSCGGSVTALAGASRAEAASAAERLARAPRTALRLADAVYGVKLSKVEENGKGVLLATIQMNGHARYMHFTLTNPHRLVVDVKNVGRVDAPLLTPVNDGGVERVRVGKYANAIRVVFDTRTAPRYRVKREEDRLLVWLDNASESESAKGGQRNAPAAAAKAGKPEVTGVHLAVSTDKPVPTTAAVATAPQVKPSPLNTPASLPEQIQAASAAPTARPTKAANKAAEKLTPVAAPAPLAPAQVTPPTAPVKPTASTKRMTPAQQAAAKPMVENPAIPTATPTPTAKANAATRAAAKSAALVKPTASASAMPTPKPALPTPPGASGKPMTAATPMPTAKPTATATPAPMARPMPPAVPTPAAIPTAKPTPVAALPMPQPKALPTANAAVSKSSLPVASAPASQPGVGRTPQAAKADIDAQRQRDAAQPRPQVPQVPSAKRAFQPADYARADYVGEPIKLDLKGVDIREVLRFVADTYKVNFVVDKSVAAETLVTVSLEDVPWNQALDALLKANRIGVKPEGHILRVMSVEAMAEEENQRRAAEMARQQATPLVTEMVRLNYARAQTGAGATGGGAASGAGGLTASASAGAAGTGVQSGLDGVIRSRLSARGTIQPDPRTNTLVITDIPENIAIIKDIIRQLDVPEPQVEIESRIVIANRNFARDLGVQLGAAVIDTSRGGAASFSTLPGAGSGSGGGTGGSSGTGRTTGPNPYGTPGGLAGTAQPLDTLRAAGASSVLGLTTGVFGTAQISLLLTAQESKGNVKTISTPRITAQNNQTANIVNGVQIPVQTESNNTVTVTYVTAALRLEITPQITETGNVVLRVVAENNSVNLAIATAAAPGINTQRAETTVLVPDGGTTIIGGINIDAESQAQQRTPGVSRIPGLGELFKRRTTTRQTDEILFFITPRIYRPLNVPTAVGPLAAPAPNR